MAQISYVPITSHKNEMKYEQCVIIDLNIGII